MKLDPNKIELLMVQNGVYSLSKENTGIASSTIARAKKGGDITPRTAAKIAGALNCDITSIIAETVVHHGKE